MSHQVYRDGVLREFWDDIPRLYTAWDAQGTQVTQRPYTAQENAQADVTAAASTAAANARTLRLDVESNIATLLTTLAALDTITARTNSTINSNPAASIKDLTREVKTVARQAIRVARIVSGAVQSTEGSR